MPVVVSVLHNGNSASDANIVKRVTFAKEATGGNTSSGSSNRDSSEDSVRTIRDASDYISILDQDKDFGCYEESSLI